VTDFQQVHIEALNRYVSPWIGSSGEADVVQAWTTGLAFARHLYGDLF
jgi:hypothetical protein